MKKILRMAVVLVAVVGLLAAVACGSAATPLVPTQPPPTETPVQGNPPPEEPATVAVPAPIEDATVIAPEEPGGAYVLKITSGLPNGCAKFSGYTVERESNRFVVEVTNLMPAPGEFIACTEIYGLHEGEAVLGSQLVVGETYTISINDDFLISFTAQDVGDVAMVEKESPIEDVELVEADGRYFLTVVSRLPLGSSCSKFNGYKVNSRFEERIEVSVTHVELAANICTTDLPVVVTQIPLGSDFAEDRNYTVSVNGREATFPEAVVLTGGDSGSNDGGTAEDSDSIEPATEVVLAPIEKSSVGPPETAGGPHILRITSGLPNGCARFDAYHLSQQDNDFVVEVRNRMPAPGQMIMCTMIYGFHEGQLTLLDSALAPGSYTVTINGELAHSFTVN